MSEELTRLQLHHYIQANESLTDVKQIARALVETNYAAKDMIARLLLKDLPGVSDLQDPTY